MNEGGDRHRRHRFDPMTAEVEGLITKKRPSMQTWESVDVVLTEVGDGSWNIETRLVRQGSVFNDGSHKRLITRIVGSLGVLHIQSDGFYIDPSSMGCKPQSNQRPRSQ